MITEVRSQKSEVREAAAERPILFTGDMVRAIMTCKQCGTITLEKHCPKCGSTERLKSETRRVIRAQPKSVYYTPDRPDWGWHTHERGGTILSCPYGKPGDVLWVRERWRCTGGGSDRWVIYRAEGDTGMSYCGINDGRMGRLTVPKAHWEEWDRLVYETTRGCEWRPGIHMFRWACRLRLKVKNVRVERVQDISAEDCSAEGIQIPGNNEGGIYLRVSGKFPPHDYYPEGTISKGVIQKPKAVLIAHFASLWDSINARRGFGWDDNPWVWVVEFEKQSSPENTG